MSSATIDIEEGIASVLASRKRLYPQHVNRISSIDDPCLRRLYYARTEWDKATETEDSLQGIFETGNLLEPIIERIVMEIGMASSPMWRIVASQTPTRDNLLERYQISGTKDGIIQARVYSVWENLGVVDIKTMSPNVYARIQTSEDLNRYPWTRKYRGQAMLYALASNLERCFLLLVNKQNLYDMRLIEFPLDMEYCEGLLQKADAVNKAVAAKDPPERLNRADECERCRFRSLCCPDIESGGNLRIVVDEELEAILDRMAEIEATANEYAELEKRRDSMLAKGKDIVCGRWLITWRSHERQGKEIWKKTIRCAA